VNLNLHDLIPPRCTLLNLSPETAVERMSIDSRDVEPATLFCPLRGEHRDGHDFILSALQSGAAASFCERSYFESHPELSDSPLILCDDTLTAMQDTASNKFGMLKPTLIAITGSVGKTSTRLLLSAVFDGRIPYSQSIKNYNNHIGMPLSLFNMRSDSRYLILEMGANHAGEIAALCRIAAPDIALITRISEAHTEGFGSMDRLTQAKKEIFEGSRPGALLVVNGDDERLRDHQDPSRRILRYGRSDNADYPCHSSIEDGRAVLHIAGRRIRTRSAGRALAQNAAAVWVIATECGIPEDALQLAIEQFEVPEGRGGDRSAGGVTLINDAYNASPASVSNALEDLQNRHCAGRRIFVFADMLELGPLSESSHRDIGRLCSRRSVDALYCFGPLSRLTVETALSSGVTEADHYLSKDELYRDLSAGLKPGDCVLFKGSRGMALETLIRPLEKDLSSATLKSSVSASGKGV